MLGAQARAAEYNAAKNASARQASREAEEQKLPPKQAPLSLSSFARTAALNRNKGTKKYNPLILEEPEEGDEDLLEDEGLDPTSPIKSPRGDIIHVPIDPENPSSGDRIRVRMPAAVPTAPKAMRPVHDSFSNASPPRMSNLPPMIPTAQYGTTADGPFAGAYPYRELARARNLPFYESLGQSTDTPPYGMRAFGNMMVPTDITPTKQEQKLSDMSQIYTNSHTGMMDPSFSMMEHAFMANPTQMQYSYLDLHGMALPQMWDFHQQQALVSKAIFQRSTLQHVHSDTPPLVRTAEAPTPARILMRQHSSLDEYAPHITPSRESVQQSSNDTSASKSKENEEPYDRNSKMQLFVAAQQALAKTGKTVLNNPDRNSQEEQPLKSTKQDVNAKETVQVRSTPGIPIEAESTPRTAPRVPPGFKPVPTGFNDFMYSSESDDGDVDADIVITSVEDVRLREAFGVGTDDWFDLKPLSSLDRQNMSAAVKNVKAKMHESFQYPLRSEEASWRSEEARKWFYRNLRRSEGVRDETERNAVGHIATLRLERSSGSFDDADTQARLLRGADDMMATINKYFLDRKQGTQEDYFNHTKPVPEFAVEQHAVFGANIGHASLFEDEKGGFYNAPTRIARDPRFRPQMREGGKIKGEDEWSYRHDTYGRRRL